MSKTPAEADKCMKLLDSGWGIRLWKNQLGSYTAQARRDDQRVTTDDFTPAQALYRLTEKVFGRIM